MRHRTEGTLGPSLEAWRCARRGPHSSEVTRRRRVWRQPKYDAALRGLTDQVVHREGAGVTVLGVHLGLVRLRGSQAPARYRQPWGASSIAGGAAQAFVAR